MKPKLYIENSIISYLTAYPSRDIITAARQALTRQWWNEKRFDYELYISELLSQRQWPAIWKWQLGV